MGAYFNEHFLSFFRGLQENNNKDWFQKHRSDYEKEVRTPFLEFVADVARSMAALGMDVETEPSRLVARINRDVRFSRDKSPYNLYMTAFFSNAGSKDKSRPGFFLRFGARDGGFMAGCYSPDKNQLLSIRRKIAANPRKFRSLLKNRTLIKEFGELQGESNVRLSAEFAEIAREEPIIARKQFYLLKEVEADFVLSANLLKQTMALWKTTRPFNDFLIDALL